MRGDPSLRGRLRRPRGFTLLEVVVALVIASLALVGLFRAGSGGLFASDTAARLDEAIERAQSHLAAFGHTGAVAPGEMEGDDGGGYRWAVRVEPVAAPGQPPGSLPGGLTGSPVLYAVEVSISWRAWGRSRSVVLETRRFGAASATE